MIRLTFIELPINIYISIFIRLCICERTGDIQIKKTRVKYTMDIT